MIKLTGINKKFGSEICLENIDLEISDGTFTALTGKSGSGKTTLLKIIGGLESPTSGTVAYDGVFINEMNEEKSSFFRNNNLGFIFQDYFLEENYTVFENVSIPLIISGISKKKIQPLVEKQLEAVDMLSKKNALVKKLSGGEKQRTAIARAMVNDPTVILADEPCGNLDSENSKNIMRILRNAVNNGKTVILVTHDNEEALKTDRIIKIHDGRITEDAVL
ncbi:ABC transporter ATP-binding protein [Porcipelethomonas sp.]|uniref:ABC transporter ATP-binding protein n=1 Tax=Porcipelethomonas sp. TaxID=2981675 RepID=UPI003077413E